MRLGEAITAIRTEVSDSPLLRMVLFYFLLVDCCSCRCLDPQVYCSRHECIISDTVWHVWGLWGLGLRVTLVFKADYVLYNALARGGFRTRISIRDIYNAGGDD